jgi:hypothetical protein
MSSGMWSSAGPAYLSLVRTGANIQQFRFPVTMYISGAGKFTFGAYELDEMPGHEINDLTGRLRRVGLMR